MILIPFISGFTSIFFIYVSQKPENVTMNAQNLVLLVTGSANRLGKAIALSMAQKGARLIIHYYTARDEALKTIEEIDSAGGSRPLVVQGDLSQVQTWENIRDKVLHAWGKIDVLVNNAAVFYRTPLLEISDAQWDHFMNVNLKGAFWGCKIFGEVMFRQKRGKIINIADIAAEQVWPGYIPYSVSKAGLVALTRGMAKALAPYVTVNAVVPGMVLPEEKFDAEKKRVLIEKIPLKRAGSAEDVANAVAFLIEGSDYITGETIKIDGGRTLV
jgi:NAD(P)-dependent dehydrogenase (short-subunit alcohol dehydrogenase family)